MNSFVIIDNQFKTYGSNSRAFYNLNLDVQKVDSIALSSYNIVDNIKNINDKNFDTMIIDDGSVSYQVSVAQDWYSYLELATALQTAMNATQIIGTPFTVVYDPATHKFTITSTFAFTLKKIGNDRSIIEMLGLVVDDALSLSKVSTGIVNINYTNKIYIASNQLHEKKTVNDATNIQNTNILGVVYLITDATQQYDKSDTSSPRSIYPKIISDRIHNPKYINLRGVGSITNLDITLLDDAGNVIPDDIGYTLEFITR